MHVSVPVLEHHYLGKKVYMSNRYQIKMNLWRDIRISELGLRIEKTGENAAVRIWEERSKSSSSQLWDSLIVDFEMIAFFL